MYTVHFKDEISTIRVFDAGSYKEKTSPLFSCTIHYISDDETYICNAVGVLSIEILRVIAKELFKKGFKFLRYEKRERMKTVDLRKYF